MTIHFPCSSCGARLQAAKEKAGSVARCPSCKTVIDVPFKTESVSESIAISRDPESLEQGDSFSSLAEQEQANREEEEEVRYANQLLAWEAGLLLNTPCPECSKIDWAPASVDEESVTLICGECDLEEQVTVDFVTAMNAGMWPENCSHCDGDTWSIVSISGSHLSSIWSCDCCGKTQRVLKQSPVRTNSPKKRKREPISKEVQREVWRRDEGRCVKCGSQENLEYDHIIPFSKGGADTVRNIQLLCEKCNRSKGNRI